MKEQFHITDMISITSGRLVSVNGIEGIYKILSHMAGTEVYTHQIPELGRQAEPVLKEAFPFLENVIVPEIKTEEDVKAFAADVEGAYGDYFEVPVLENPRILSFPEAQDAARKYMAEQRAKDSE